MNHRPVFVGPLLHLGTLPHFRGLPAPQLAVVAHEMEEVVLERGSQLIQAGEPADAMYMILDGFVALGPDGRAGRVGPGGVLGFLESLSDAEAPVSAYADTDVVALRLDTDTLRGLCEQSFAVLGTLLEYLARRAMDSGPALIACVAGDATKWPVGEKTRLDRVGRILALHRAPLFPSFGMDGLAELSDQMEEVRLEAGAVLWEAGQMPGGFYLVCEGSVSMFGPGNGEAWVGQGSVPGLIASLAREPAPTSVRAVERCTLLRAGTEHLLDVLEDHFEMSFGLLGRLAASLLAEETRGVPQRPPSP